MPKILAIDDHSANLRTLHTILTHALPDTVLFVAQSGQTGLESAHINIPDVILLDIVMPGMEGYEVCKWLKTDDATKHIPVIMLTAYDTDTSSRIRALNVGADAFLAKPFDEAELIAQINAMLRIKYAEDKLRQQNGALRALMQERTQELQETLASKDKFFAIIAHDLRAPFSAFQSFITLFTYSLEQRKYNQLPQLTELLQQNVDHLNELLENLLTWAQLERGILTQHPNRFKLWVPVVRMCELFAPVAEQKQITLTQTISEQISVYADFNAVETVVRNLLSNALKFSHPGGAVTISAKETAQAVEIAVTDTGIGISATGLAKLFRIDANYREKGVAGEKGTGLGLILCQEFVGRNGGTIWAESERDKGSTFYFTLPKSKE